MNYKKLIILSTLILIFNINIAISKNNVASGNDSVFSYNFFPAIFDHELHFEVLNIECNICHHSLNKNFLNESITEEKACITCHNKKRKENPSLSKSLHNNCKQCHKNQRKGPLSCGNCHKKK